MTTLQESALHADTRQATKHNHPYPYLSSAELREIFLLLVGYRQGMRVTEVMAFQSAASGEVGYYVCPRCRITMEREFMAFCDRCGQKLDWRFYKQARKIYPGDHH